MQCHCFEHSTRALFAWLGRCSLVTFTLQYHVWLAADTKGLLCLVFCSSDVWGGLCERWCKWVEFWIISVFFLWVSWGVSKATNSLTEWIVRPAQPQATLGEGGDKREGRTFAVAHDNDQEARPTMQV
jgi:N-acetylneuraminate 9-O-acetyltransferase